MIRRATLSVLIGVYPILTPGLTPSQVSGDSGLVPLRAARDRGDLRVLLSAAEAAQTEASQKHNFDAYVRLARLEDWICEAAYTHQDKRLVKQAAQAGASAARDAVQLNPNSSDAHWLLSSLLGELIPHVFAGGPRYGPESTREADKAIALNPRNADAYIARARTYFFTPAMFGGSKPKAVEMLKKAIEIDPGSDAAATAHIWLARAYFELGQRDDARREIREALHLNLERRFAQYVNKQILSTKNESSE